MPRLALSCAETNQPLGEQSAQTQRNIIESFHAKGEGVGVDTVFKFTTRSAYAKINVSIDQKS